MGLPEERRQHGETGVWGAFVGKVVHLLEAMAKNIFVRIFFGADERLKKKSFCGATLI